MNRSTSECEAGNQPQPPIAKWTLLHFSGPQAWSYTTGAAAMKMRYDASAGDGFVAQNTLTETTIGTAGDVNTTWRASTSVAVGATVTGTTGAVFLSRYVNYKLAEQVWIHGTPTTDEMNEWKDYVNTRYGTIIS